MFIKFGPRDLLQIGHLKFAHACIMLCVQSGQGLYGDHGNIISLGSGSEVLNQSEGKSPSRQALLWQIRPNPIHLHIAFMITIKLVFLQNLVPLISPPSKASVQQTVGSLDSSSFLCFPLDFITPLILHDIAISYYSCTFLRRTPPFFG